MVNMTTGSSSTVAKFWARRQRVAAGRAANAGRGTSSGRGASSTMTVARP